jgi:hypothetical protein
MLRIKKMVQRLDNIKIQSPQKHQYPYPKHSGTHATRQIQIVLQRRRHQKKWQQNKPHHQNTIHQFLEIVFFDKVL